MYALGRLGEDILSECNCAHCGVAVGRFITSGRPRKYCSNKCAEAAYQVRHWVLSRVVLCPVCWEKHNPRDGRKGKPKRYCSNECANRARIERNRLRYFREKLSGRKKPYYFGACVDCGEACSAGSVLCKRCRNRTLAADSAAKNLRMCKHCGNAYIRKRRVDGEGDSYCSRECASKSHQSKKVDKSISHSEVRGWRRNSRSRAIKFGVKYENFSPIRVFKRDGWKCKACGCDTPMHLRGTMDDNAPELDHVVALAAGGSHTYENAQCLCRVCNILKRDHPMSSFVNQWVRGASNS